MIPSIIAGCKQRRDVAPSENLQLPTQLAPVALSAASCAPSALDAMCAYPIGRRSATQTTARGVTGLNPVRRASRVRSRAVLVFYCRRPIASAKRRWLTAVTCSYLTGLISSISKRRMRLADWPLF
jgi:hypothetical protein